MTAAGISTGNGGAPSWGTSSKRRAARRSAPVAHLQRRLFVAGAGGPFQPAVVEDRDVAAAVLDQLPALQGGGRFGDAGAAYAEHVTEELVRHAELVRGHAI